MSEHRTLTIEKLDFNLNNNNLVGILMIIYFKIMMGRLLMMFFSSFCKISLYFLSNEL